MSNQKGFAHILILIAAIGLVAFLLVSSTAYFKDNLFAKLYPKQSSFASEPISGPISPPPNPVVWTGKYYAYRLGDTTKGLNGTPILIRQDSEVKFNWGNGSPAANISNDRFSARWTRTESFSAGIYLITIRHNDGMRLYIDGLKVYDKWSNQEAVTRTFTKALTQGKHAINVEYYEALGLAEAQVTWVKQ